MSWLVVLGVSLLAFIGAGIAWRGRAADRRCPTCDADYEVVAAAGSGPNATYDVLGCPTCANTATLVHGARVHFATCPACANHSLETASSRKRDERRIEVRERCHLCSFERVFAVGEDVGPLGKVLPFPGNRTRRKDGSTGEP